MTFMTLTKYLKYVRSPLSLLFIEYARSISYLSNASCLASIDVLLVHGGYIGGLIAEGVLKKTVESALSHLLL